MAEDLTDFFSTDSNNWNFSEMTNKPSVDPYDNKKKLDPFGYHLMKYNCVIMLKESLNHTSQYIQRMTLKNGY